MKHSWAILNMVLKVLFPPLTADAQLVGERSPLYFFENRKQVPWFCKIAPWFWKKGALFVYIYVLNCHLKCSFKSILDKKTPFFLLVGIFYCISYLKRLLNCPYSKKPPLPHKIPDYAPGLYAIKVLQDFQN